MPVDPGMATIILVSMLSATGMAVIAFVSGLEPPYGRVTTFLFTPLGSSLPTRPTLDRYPRTQPARVH